MSILRFDLTTNDWVVFAPDRKRRPDQFGHANTSSENLQEPSSQPGCPFCPGGEGTTPPEIFALRGGTRPDGPGWRVRVIPNKFPALRIEEDSQRVEAGGTFRWMGGCGAHEVIVESPDHHLFLGHQPVEQIEFLFRTMQIRYNDLMRDRRFQTVILFKNHGEGAGTSLRHPHCQLIATPVVPRLLRTKHEIATDYFDLTGRCLYCVLLTEESAAGERMIAENKQFSAFAPYASHVPFEIWILPKHHQSSFGHEDGSVFRHLAELVQIVLSKLHKGLGNPDFNLTLHTAPRGDEEKEYFLWHIEIVPRLTKPAGFELGSGMSINTVMPEEAAASLRGVEIQ